RDSGSLQVALDVSGDYTPAIDGGEIVLLRNGKPLLRYAGLRSWDAGGRQLKSHAVVEGSRIKLIVDDRGARYPVTIDPVVQAFTLTAPDAVAGHGFGPISAAHGEAPRR